MSLDSPHDALFKEIFSNPEHARVELRAVLPPALVAKLDWTTLHVEPSSFVELGDRDRHADLLFSVDLEGRPTYIYVVFEHQSSPDAFMPLRLLGYAVRVWERFRRENEEVRFLPPIVSVVLHHGESGWNKPVSFHDLFDPALLNDLHLAEFLPAFRFVLDDLSHASDDELLRRAEREFESVVPVVLWALRDARNGQKLLASFPRWAEALSLILRAPSGKDALLAVFGYISIVAEVLSPDAIIAAVDAAAPETKDTVMTLAEIWMQQGLEKGIEKGRLEGIEKGVAKGERAILVKLLTFKFGPLAETHRAQIEAASPAQLEAWTEKVLTASSVDELFG